jgi:uncharacterized membrane protein YccC
MSVHQGSDRPARYSTKAILAAVRALADACIDHATDLNFSLHVAPMLFLCALLLAHKRSHLIGFFSAQLFASAGLFQNQMAYDPVGLVNTAIAAVVADAVAMVLWSIVAPTTPEAAHRRFVRAVRKALPRIATPHPRTRLAEFETAMSEPLDHLRSHLRPDRLDDIARSRPASLSSAVAAS